MKKSLDEEHAQEAKSTIKKFLADLREKKMESPPLSPIDDFTYEQFKRAKKVTKRWQQAPSESGDTLILESQLSHFFFRNMHVENIISSIEKTYFFLPFIYNQSKTIICTLLVF